MGRSPPPKGRTEVNRIAESLRLLRLLRPEAINNGSIVVNDNNHSNKINKDKRAEQRLLRCRVVDNTK